MLSRLYSHVVGQCLVRELTSELLVARLSKLLTSLGNYRIENYPSRYSLDTGSLERLASGNSINQTLKCGNYEMSFVSYSHSRSTYEIALMPRCINRTTLSFEFPLDSHLAALHQHKVDPIA